MHLPFVTRVLIYPNMLLDRKKTFLLHKIGEIVFMVL